jgi:hypothetical protein
MVLEKIARSINKGMITRAQGLCWSTNSPSNNTLANQIPTTIKANKKELLFYLSSCKKFLLALIFALPNLA